MSDFIYEVEAGTYYLSNYGKGYLCRVDQRLGHGQDCSLAMVVYTVLEPTFDKPANTPWVVSESFFLSRFRLAGK